MREASGRTKRHTLLLALDEFPQLGRMPFFETMMGAMAGYGIKAYLVCQSPNHIARAYGRDNVIVDNCHIVTSFAAADGESAKAIAEMAGEVWEVRPQQSEQRPRSLLGPRKGAVTYREERRPLMLPGEVRQLPRDQQLIFVSGAKPIRAKKLQFDHEPIFANRLMPAAHMRVVLTTTHDWSHVAPLGHLVRDKASGAVRVEPMQQGNLFEPALSISEKVLAGLRASAATASAPNTESTGATPRPSRPTRRTQRTGV